MASVSDVSGYVTAEDIFEEPQHHPAPKLSTADKLRRGWWNISYGFLGIYTMLDAPQLGLVKIRFLIDFLNNIRQTSFVLLFALQGLSSLSYTPLTTLITMKFSPNNPYDTHEPLFVICILSYLSILVCFAIIFLLVFYGAHENPRNKWKCRVLYGVTVCSISVVPVSLIGVICLPADWVWTATIVGGCHLVALIFGYLVGPEFQ